MNTVRERPRHRGVSPALAAACAALALGGDAPPARSQTADAVRRLAGVEAGLAVHVGATDGRLEAELAAGGRWLVHGLALEDDAVAAARRAIEQQGLCGPAAVERWLIPPRLPYAENLVNLLIADLDALGDRGPSEAEILRAVAPGGAAVLKRGGAWRKAAKPRPAGMDEWTHLHHGADGNPASKDTLVPDPYGLRWIGSEVMGWGVFSLRAAGGRLLLFWDTFLQWVDKRPDRIRIEARDAFSGVFLWEQYYPLPAKYRVRPVAVGDRVYMLAGAHVAGIDAADGRILVSYTACETPYDCIVHEGVVLCRNEKAVYGFDAPSGRLLWSREVTEHPSVLQAFARLRQGHFQPGWKPHLLVAGGDTVFAADHRTDAQGNPAGAVVGLDIRTGREIWRSSGPDAGALPHPCFYHAGRLFLVNEFGYAGVPVDAPGKPWLVPVGDWKSPRRPDKKPYRGLEGPSFLFTDGLVWVKDHPNQRLGDDPYAGKDEKPYKGWVGFDPATGEARRRIHYPTKQDWSGRCYADVALPDRIVAENMEIVDLNKPGEFRNFRAARGQCGNGFIFAYGQTVAAPHRCVSCYPMLRGAAGLSGASDRGAPIADGRRLERGPAAERVAGPAAPPAADEWPLYRHDPLRTSATPMKPPGRLQPKWSIDLRERTTAPSIAGGRLVVAAINAGRVCAFDARTGKPIWSFVAGGRIDTPPTLYGALCLFGAHDGAIYALRAKDGAPAWRYHAAPEDRRIVAYDRVESPWPAMGSVLVHDGVAYAIAGRVTRADGGMAFVALDALSGEPVWRRSLTGFYGQEAHVLPQSWHVHEEHMTNNVLTARGGSVRLDDEFGTWQFSAKDGRLEGRSHDIPQPGWPRGRRTPKDAAAAERWPWCGWDRVSLAEILAGKDTVPVMAHGMHPGTRAAPKYQWWFFPDARRVGIHAQRLNKENEFVLEPARFEGEAPGAPPLPWAKRKVELDGKAYLFAACGDVLAIGGGTPIAARHTAGRIQLIAMADGKDVATAELPAAVCYDGLAAAYGCLYAATTDGHVHCLGD